MEDGLQRSIVLLVALLVKVLSSHLPRYLGIYLHVVQSTLILGPSL